MGVSVQVPPPVKHTISGEGAAQQWMKLHLSASSLSLRGAVQLLRGLRCDWVERCPGENLVHGGGRGEARKLKVL